MENGTIWDGAITKITAEYDGRVANQPLKGVPLCMPQVAYNISFTGRMEVTRQQQDTLR